MDAFNHNEKLGVSLKQSHHLFHTFIQVLIPSYIINQKSGFILIKVHSLIVDDDLFLVIFA